MCFEVCFSVCSLVCFEVCFSSVLLSVFLGVLLGGFRSVFLGVLLGVFLQCASRCVSRCAATKQMFWFLSSVLPLSRSVILTGAAEVGQTQPQKEREKDVGKYSNTAIWQGFRPVPTIIPISQSCELVGQINLVFG